MKIRRGGLAEFEKRVLAGDTRAMRALVRQASGPNTLHLPFQDVELRAKPDGTGGSRLLFTGYASVTEQPFTMWDWLGDYQEIVRGGAFTKTLSEEPDVIFCVNHDWGAVPMARTKPGSLRLSEDDIGLPVEADLDPKRSDVAILQSAMDGEELDAMSFAFYVTKQTWSPDYDQRDILEVDLDGGDVAVVTYPANPATTGTTALRSRAANALARSRVPHLIVERARAEKRAGATLSAATIDILQEVLDLVSEADDAVDSAQVILSELMGVPNPDDDDQAEDTSDDDPADEADQEADSAPTPEPETLADPTDTTEYDLQVALRERQRLAAAARR